MAFLRHILLMIILAVFSTFYGCEEKSTTTFLPSKTTQDKTSFNTNFDGQLYSIPAAVPTFLNIHALGFSFDSLMLHSTTKANHYKNKSEQAINFGMYCADIYYIAINQNNKKCLSFLKPVKHLAEKLELEHVFNADFISQFENLVSHEHHLLALINKHFSQADFLLKSNDRKNISALILTGSWLKSIYITTQLYEEYKHPQLLKHIGEQKQTLKAVLSMLEKYNINGQNDKYIAHFSPLKALFGKVKILNNYIPSHQEDKEKLTSIKNEIEIDINEDIAQKISVYVERIHNSIIAS